MSITKDKIHISKIDGWTKVLDVAGFAVVLEKVDYEFAYVNKGESAPLPDMIGNLVSNRFVTNNDNSDLYFKTIWYDLTVIPNEE